MAQQGNMAITTGAGTSPTAGMVMGGGGGGGWGSYLGGALGTAADIYGSQNSAEAVTKGNNAGIVTQQNTMGNINSLYGGQSTLGNQAFSTIGGVLGLNGAPPNYSAFTGSPGLAFAESQGTQAINRNAAAMGNAYSTSTLADVGKQVTGTAMQDYNNYISQLMEAGGFGAQANQNLSGAQLRTGGNISQMQSNNGVAQAGGYTSAAGTLAPYLSKLPWGQIGNGVSSLFNQNTSGVDPNAGGASPYGNYGAGGNGPPDPNASPDVYGNYGTGGNGPPDPNASGDYGGPP